MIEEILSNSIRLGDIRIPNFTPQQKADASVFAKKVYSDCYDGGSLIRDELTEILNDLGYWTQSDEEEFKQDLNHLQQMKVDYYENFNILSRATSIKKSIKLQTEAINREIARRSQFVEYTCEYASEEAFFMYLVKDYSEPFFLYRKFSEWKLPEDAIRDLYFDNTWKVAWSITKNPQELFGCSINYLNDNQLNLLYWSKTYDTIQQIEDAPSYAAMQDVYAVDGWMTKYNRKKEAEDKTKTIKNNAAEVYLPVRSRQEAREIIELNSPEARSVLKSRSKDLQKSPELNERQFSFVKQDIGMKINELNSRRN